jgi:hypothetical protein
LERALWHFLQEADMRSAKGQGILWSNDGLATEIKGFTKKSYMEAPTRIKMLMNIVTNITSIVHVEQLYQKMG